ncbi:MAG: efflux RND transporter periplasmic adaptor subunit [Bacteroidota bacterium]
MKQKQILRFAIILIVLLLLFIVIGRRAGWIDSTTGIRVTLEEAERRSITEIVTASGKVQPVTEVKISPDVSGEIVEILAKEGDFVNKGDLLVRINPEIYVSALDRVEASLNSSRANLSNARARKAQAEAQFINARAAFQRNEQLFEQDAISESEFDTARAQFLVAQAEVEASTQSVVGAEFQVKSAEATLREARENLTKTSIFSPMDGTISRLDAELGERVVGTSQFAGTEILRIANLNEMEVLVEVNENDIIRVNEGDTALIEIDAYMNQQFRGLVTSIANSALEQATGVDQVTNFEVRIRILTESYAHLLEEETPHLSPFRPGMSASADIQTMQVSDVVSIPIQAVTTRPEEKEEENNQDNEQDSQQPDVEEDADAVIQEYVFLYQENGSVKLTKVESGIQDSNFIEIQSGINEGDSVVTGPFRAVSRELNDGDMVTPVSRDELFTE